MFYVKQLVHTKETQYYETVFESNSKQECLNYILGKFNGDTYWRSTSETRSEGIFTTYFNDNLNYRLTGGF
jgi:hypothetical protein